jgi:hypothetical protein
MSERVYLFLVGCIILAALYFELDGLMYALLILLAFEGITDIRLTTLLQDLRKRRLAIGLVTFGSRTRFGIDVMRAWRLVLCAVLSTSFILVNQYGVDVIWFFPWFMGFAILGAGASGVCPMALALKWLGFR